MPALLRRPSFQDQIAPPAARASPVHLAAPIKGWNTRDPVAMMDPLYALTLDNWFPRQGEVEARQGWTEWGLPGIVDPVMALVAHQPVIAGTPKLFGFTPTHLYQVREGNIPSTVATVTVTSGDWTAVNFTNTVGTTFLWAANGVDQPVVYNGTTWTTLSPISTPPITGITLANTLTAPWVYMRRIFAIEYGTMNAWYLPVDSIGGEAKRLPIGGLFKLGGYLVAGTSWTQDGGDGTDDLCVFITSEGEIAVYQGDNPNSAASWGLQGVYYVGRPASKRCFQKLGGDVAVLTEMGVLPLSKAIRADRLGTATALSDAIRPTIMDRMAEVINNNWFGASIILYPAQNALIVNVPTETTVAQYVMNTITGAWCSFSGLWALSTIVYEGKLLMGFPDGTVAEAWNTDANGDDTVPIQSTVQTAFVSMAGGRVKKLLQFRPLIVIDKDTLIEWGFVSDYRNPALTSSFTQDVNDLPYWDVAIWDNALWDVVPYRLATWLTATSIEGYALSIAMRVTSQSAAISWSGTDYLVEVGGLL